MDRPGGLQMIAPGNRPASLGAALQFLAARAPFSRFPAEVLVGTVHGVLARQHCLFAMRGQRLCGVIGWAMLDATVAARLRAGGPQPTPEECATGRDVAWVLIVAATDRAAMLGCINGLRARAPGVRAMGVRHRADGQAIVFDQPIRLRQDEAGAPAEALRP